MKQVTVVSIASMRTFGDLYRIRCLVEDCRKRITGKAVVFVSQWRRASTALQKIHLALYVLEASCRVAEGLW